MRENRPSRQPPTIDPGQIWIIEQDPATSLSAIDRDALSHANVVIYDRALAALVAQALPIGGYAEPASAAGPGAAPAISPRVLDLAGAGWSVVRLVEANPDRRARLRLAPPTMVATNGAGDPPVQVIAKTGGDRYRASRIERRELGERLGEVGENELLTLVFEPIATPHATPAQGFTANGLAG